MLTTVEAAPRLQTEPALYDETRIALDVRDVVKAFDGQGAATWW